MNKLVKKPSITLLFDLSHPRESVADVFSRLLLWVGLDFLCKTGYGTIFSKALLPVAPRKLMLIRKSPGDSIEAGSLTTICERQSKFGTLRTSSTTSG